MPQRAKRICNHPGCHAVQQEPRCLKHTKQQQRDRDAYRGNANERGYGRRWRKARLAYLAEHPLCGECETRGRVEAATVVDHIRPHRGDAGLFWDRGNWQSLCRACHDAKTSKGL